MQVIDQGRDGMGTTNAELGRDACCGNEACCVVFLYPFGFAPDPCFSDMAAFVTALWFVIWRVSIVDVMYR